MRNKKTPELEVGQTVWLVSGDSDNPQSSKATIVSIDRKSKEVTFDQPLPNWLSPGDAVGFFE